MNAVGKLIKSRTISFIEVLIKNYKKIGLNEIEAIILCKLYYLYLDNKNNLSTDILSKEMSLDENELANKIVELVNLGYMEIKLVDGKEEFSLDLTIDKLGEVLEKNETSVSQKQNKLSNIVSIVETTFNRNVTATDLKVINYWLDDDFSFEDIKRALIKTMQAGKNNLSYADAILNRNKPREKVVEDNDEELKAILDSVYVKK